MSKWPSTLMILWFGIALTSLYANAQTFKVRVLDALNGKPYEGIFIHVECAGSWTPGTADPMTDANGDAQLQYHCKDNAPIRIDTNTDHTRWMGDYDECGSLDYKNIDQIVKVGIISDPSGDGGIWCPRKFSKKLKPIPGQVIIFYKKMTWYEKNVAP